MLRRGDKGHYMTMLTKVQIWSSFLLIILVTSTLCACRNPAPEVANEGELSTYHLEIDLLGTKHKTSVDSQGRLKTSIEASSSDGEISLFIREGTAILNKGRKPLETIHVAIDPNPPHPPEDVYIIGTVYNLRPQGATFNPPLKLTLAYDPEQLPEGARESDVYILPYDEDTGWGRWHYKSVDIENHRVSAQVDRSSKLAVLIPMATNGQSTSQTPDILADVVEVVYFHRPHRCAGCIYAETATRFTLETYFADELAEGKIVFKLINLGDKANAAIVEHYGAYTSSLFINSISGGIEHIEEVKEIWFLLGKDSEFVALVKNKIDRYLSEERP